MRKKRWAILVILLIVGVTGATVFTPRGWSGQIEGEIEKITGIENSPASDSQTVPPTADNHGSDSPVDTDKNLLSLTVGNKGILPTSVADKHKLALIRLEDIGPGGPYNSLDDLGKLRAVVDFLRTQGVPFQVAVIPRYKTINPDGSWNDRGIDDPTPLPETQAFINMLYYMNNRGGTLGMHGYTHQYGAVKRADNQQDSATGCEFNLAAAPDSSTPAYAAERLELALKSFEKIGLAPAFWETPHSIATAEQRAVFHSGFGIQYESLQKKDLDTVYLEGENQFSASSLGAVYVPTPLYYIEGGTKAKSEVDSILRRMIFFSGLASFFYHPFLEYPFLEPVLGYDGKPQVVDGLPLYRYREGQESYLQQLVKGLRDWGYSFVSLKDVVPFTPGSRLKLPSETNSTISVGDFNGDGKAEILDAGLNRIQVSTVKIDQLRWKSTVSTYTWLDRDKYPDLKGCEVFKGDFNGDGREDLVFYRRKDGYWFVTYSNGHGFDPPQLWLKEWGKGDRWNPYIGDFNGDGNDDILLINLNDKNCQLAANNGKEFVPQTSISLPWLSASQQIGVGDVNGDKKADLTVYDPVKGTLGTAPSNGSGFGSSLIWLTDVDKHQELLMGDLNGDKLTDTILWNSKEGKWSLYFSDGKRFIPSIRPFGPWGRGDGKMALIGDFFGEGKGGLTLITRQKQNPDTLWIDLAYGSQ